MAFTRCVLGVEEFSKHSLSLNQNRYWQGYGDPPTEIREPETLPPGTEPPFFVFQHSADSVGSVGGLVYDIQRDVDPYTVPPKWVIAWSNEIGKSNKVYTTVLRPDKSIDWDEIKKSLDGSVNDSGSANIVDAYSPKAIIEPAEGDTPTMKATLTHHV